MSSLTLLCLLAAQPGPNPTEADQLFVRARDLMKKGHTAEACPLLEKSQSLDPALGTLLNLADCYEQTGHGVQAYLRFNEAAGWAERTHEAKREEVARSRAAALKNRLSWLSLSAATPVPGLTATVLEFHVPLGTGAESVPLDPGSVTVTVAAPGYEPWSTQVTVGPAEVKAVSVPSLIPLAAPVTGTSPADAPVTSTPPLMTSAPAAAIVVTQPPPGPSPTGGVVLIGTGAAVLVAGAVGLGWSFSTYSQLQQQQPGQPNAANPTVTLGQFHTLQWIYPTSWAAVALGGAAIGSGALWYVRAKKVGVAFVPTPGGSSLAVTGQF
jgi:hypothetical protein